MRPQTQPNNRKAKLYNSRTIRSEAVDPSFKDGILDIPGFVSSREYEIKAFEQSQLKTKQASSSRVFQSLPRSLRRRAASHNVKRIPKRLRAAAIKEMQNSTTGVPQKKKEPRGRIRHRLRVQKRLLALASKIKKLRSLPESDGSASMPERLKELNIQLKKVEKTPSAYLNNIVGAYDHTGINELIDKPIGNVKFAKRQLSHTWIPTHLWHAKRFHMIKRWGFQIPMSPNQKCFRAASRAAKQSALIYDTSYYCELLMECKSEADLFSVLLQITKYNEPIPEWLTRLSRSYHGWIYKEGERFSPGTVLVNGSSIYVRVHPAVYEDFFKYCSSFVENQISAIQDCRYSLGSIRVQGPSSLQSLAKVLHIKNVSSKTLQAWRLLSSFNDSDLIPQGTTFSFFVEDPRYWKKPVNNPNAEGKVDLYEILQEQRSFIEHDALKTLYLTHGRNESYKNMLSLKQIGKEFAQSDIFSQKIHGKCIFPVLITKEESHWIMTLPWYWITPTWSKLVQVSGLKAAGLRQFHQINFEQGKQTFPHDFPFLPDGFEDNYLIQASHELSWKQLPLSKRRPLSIERELKPCGADWYFLRKWTFGLFCLEKDTLKTHEFGEFTDEGKRRLINEEDLEIVLADGRDLLERKEYENRRIPISLYKKSDSIHKSYVNGDLKVDRANFPSLPVVPVHLTLQTKGTISDYARIYSIPSDKKPELRNLIGFITTGAMNMKFGHPTGIGMLNARFKDSQTVMIRNVGCTTYRVAKVRKI